jgi:hypothetical protein
MMLFVVAWLCVLVHAQLVVQTQEGFVSGVALPLGNGVNASGWLGIPYAESTAGANRWTKASAKQAWTGVKQTTDFGPGCPQNCLLPPGGFGQSFTFWNSLFCRYFALRTRCLCLRDLSLICLFFLLFV